MADKRLLTDALSLSPRELEFIQSGEDGRKLDSKSQRKEVTKTIELTPPLATSSAEDRSDAPQPQQRRQRRRFMESVPNVDEVLGEVRIPLTTRLPHRLVQSLRRECLEQRLKYIKPDTIQDVVEMAIEDWLSKRAR